MSKEKEFKEKLDKLLHEYNADIWWYCDDCSNTREVYNDYIGFEFKGSNKVYPITNMYIRE